MNASFLDLHVKWPREGFVALDREGDGRAATAELDVVHLRHQKVAAGVEIREAVGMDAGS